MSMKLDLTTSVNPSQSTQNSFDHVGDHSEIVSTAEVIPTKVMLGVRAFAKLVVLFWLPIIVVLLALEWVLWVSGETWPLERVIIAQEANRDAVFMRDYLDQNFYRYKYLQIQRRHPRIISVGSSRVMKFRSLMFGNQSSQFYNAGGMTRSIGDLQAFIEALPADTTPEVVILGVDMWWLNDNFPESTEDGFSSGMHEDGAYIWQGHVLAMRALVCDLKEMYERADTGDTIGIHARLARTGFRFDGSMKDDMKTPVTPAEWVYRDRDEKEPFAGRIRMGIKRFQFTYGISPALVRQLRKALLQMKLRHILVIGFNPPLASECARLMQTHPKQRMLWEQYQQQVPAIFYELGLPFYNASAPDKLGLNDSYMQDGIHAQETFHVHLLQHLCKDKRVQSAMPDLSRTTHKLLEAPATNPWRPDYNAIGNPY